MNTYIYRADIYCEDCAEKIMNRLNAHTVADNRDSENYPQGPYGNGGGEADCPQHCGKCGLFLENPLTEDGYRYVLEHTGESYGGKVAQRWREFYGIHSETL